MQSRIALSMQRVEEGRGNLPSKSCHSLSGLDPPPNPFFKEITAAVTNISMREGAKECSDKILLPSNVTIAHLIYLSDNLFHSSSPLTGVWSLPGPDGTSLLNLVKLQPSAICSTKPTFWYSSKQPSNAPSFHPDGTAPPFQCYLQTKTWRLLLFIGPTAGTTRPIKGKMLFHPQYCEIGIWEIMNIDCCQFWVCQVKVVAGPWVSIKPWQLCPLSLIASHNHTSPTPLYIFLPISKNIWSSDPADL